MSWSASQRELLGAMGYTLWQPAHARATARAADTGTVPDDPLVHALLRAAGRDASATDAATLSAGWAPVGRLRTPQAKRALWPTLRALRPRG